MAITKTYQLDMAPGGVPVVVHVSQYDDDFTLVFNLYASSGTFTVESGTAAKIRGTKKDGKGYSVNAAMDVTNKKVTVTGDQQMTAVAGKNNFELTLIKGEKELNTANFVLDVERAALDRDTISSESKIMELLDVTDKADNIVNAAYLVENALSSLGFDDPESNGNIVITMDDLIPWDFTWNASLGELPPGMTSATDTYDFTTEPGALRITRPNMLFDHSDGDCELEVVIKFYDVESGKGNKNPQIGINASEEAGARFLGYWANDDPFVYSNLSGSYQATSVRRDEYHKFLLRAENSIFFLYADGNLIDSGPGAAAAFTGIKDSAGNNIVYIKSIRFRTLY